MNMKPSVVDKGKKTKKTKPPATEVRSENPEGKKRNAKEREGGKRKRRTERKGADKALSLDEALPKRGGVAPNEEGERKNGESEPGGAPPEKGERPRAHKEKTTSAWKKTYGEGGNNVASDVARCWSWSGKGSTATD